MASSIEVSIQAKIEGWREQLKQIENAASKIDVGSGIGKNISKEFDVLSKQVDQFSRHLTQKITSADQIDHLLLSLSHVDEGFKAIGDTIAGVSFEDLKPEYITDGFKDLINQIKQTKQELSSGLEASFQNAVKGSDKLQETFSKLKLDPSKMNISEAGQALTSYAEKLAQQVADGNKEIDSMQERLKNLRETARSMQNLSIIKMGDTTTAARETIGNTSDIGKFAINKDVIASVSRTVENALTNYADQLKSKKEEIEQTLKELIDADTIDQAREKLNALSELFNNTGLRGKIHFEASDVKNFSKQLEQYIPDETVISERLERIRRLLIDNGISEADLNKIMPSADKLLHNGGFDELSHKIAEALNKSKHAAENGVTAVNEEMKKLSAELNEKRSTTMKVAAERYKADRSVEEYKNLLIQIQNENKDLKNRVEQLEKILHSDATKEIQKTGAGISKNSQDNLNGALNTAKMYRTELEQVQAREQMIGKIQGVVQRWFSIYAAIRMAGNAVRSVISTIKELDSTITEIAIVTNMTQSQLWKQMNSYTTLARQYAASISGVYQVSQLYYQQGLGQSDVMALTEQTLKMARISGLDYAQATDFMTNAVRSFKMEMTEAAKVVDVYSAIAAASATDTTELASAMSKTASSAQAVGSSFENTTAMMAVMIEATRESAENIGSAMKSIISRYGEMTSDPSKLVDSEGQVMSLNRVDKALQTVGISIHDAQGEFRRFDDVIMELAQSWDTIDTNTQRYIATIMAGNRQQSRFLALVSSYDRLKQLSETAMNSEDASQLQFLKTLDSVAAKTQQLETSLQTLYVGSGLEETYKGILDIANNIIKSFTNMPTILGKPIPAILKIGTTFFSVANAVTTLFGVLKHKVNLQIQALSGESAAQTANTESQITTQLQQEINKRIAEQQRYYTTVAALQQGASAEQAVKIGQSTYNMQQQNIQQGENVEKADFFTKFGKGTRNAAIISVGASLAGSFISTFASSLQEGSQRELKASATVLGGTLQGIGIGSMFGPYGTLIGGIAGFVKSYIESIDILVESSEEKLERLKNTAEEANNKRIESTANYNNLKSELDQIKELEKTYNDSAEAKAEYYEHSNALAEQYPQLVLAYDTEGNAVLNLTNAYKVLKQAKDEASDDNTNSIVANLNEAEELEKQARGKYETAQIIRNSSSITSLQFKNDSLMSLDNNGLKNLLTSIMNQNKGQINAATILESIFNTSNLDVIPDNSSLINQLLSYSYGFGDANTLDNIFKSGDNLQNLKAEINAISDKNLQESLRWFVEAIENAQQELLPEEGNYQAAKFNTESLRKKAIADYTKDRITDLTLDAQYNNGAPAEYLSEFSEINTIINGQIYDLMVAAKERTEKEPDKAFDYQEWFNSPELSSAYDALFSTLSTFWEGLDLTKQSDFNKLLQSRGKLSEGQFKEQLQKFPGIVDSSGQFFTWVNELIKYYNNAFDLDKFEAARKERIEARGNKELNLDQIIAFQHDISEMGPQELSNLLKIYDQLEKEINSNVISEDNAGVIFDQYLQAFEASSEEIQSLLFNTDIFSFSSIMDTIHKLEGEEFDSKEAQPAIDALRQIGHLIPLNLNTETQTLLDKFNEGLSDFESSVKNATKGMNFKTMSEEVNKLDLSFDSYELKDGKYYIKDYIALSNSLIEQQAGIFADLNRELDDRKQQALNSEDTIASSLGFTEDEYDKFWQEFLHDSDRQTDNVIEYYFQQKKKELNSSMGEAEKYTRDLLARSALEAGRIADFAQLAMGNEVWKGLSDDDQAAIVSAVAKGDISGLTAEQQEYFAQYNSLIISTYQGIQQSIASSLMSGLFNGSGRIKVTDTNKDQLQKLQNKGWLKDGNLDTGNYIEIAVEELQKNESEFMQYVLSTYDNENDKIKALKEYHANKYKQNNTINTLSKVAESNVIAYDDYINYLTSKGYTSGVLNNSTAFEGIMKTDGLKMNAAGNLVVDDIEAWITDLTNTLEKLPENASVEERNDLKAKIANAHNLLAQAQKKAIEDAVSNYDKITVDQKTALANALKVSTEELDPYFTANADGLTSTFDIVGFQQAIQEGNITIEEAAQQYLISGIATLYDNALSAITNTHKLAISGTTDMAEMQKFVDSYNKKLNKKKTVQELFKYNNVVGGFVVDPRVTQTYVQAQIQELVRAGQLKPEDIQSYVKTNAAKNVDISKYLSSERTSADLETLNTSLVSYYASIITMPKEDLANYEEELAKWQVKVQDEAQKTSKAIQGGGQAAVDEMLKIDPQATSEQLQAAYEAQIAPIKAAAEVAESLEVGSFVSTEQIDALTKAGFEFEGNRVTKVATNLADAYKSLYNQMAETGEATISTLNSTAAKALDAPYKGKRNGIEAISKGMLSIEEFIQTYTDAEEEFGINGDYEKQLQNLIDQGYISRNSFGQIDIVDFKGYAATRGWQDASEEYKAAYTSWVDARIAKSDSEDFDKQEASQLNTLASAKVGQRVNVSQISETVRKKLSKAGLSITGDWLEVTSEQTLNEALLALDSMSNEYKKANPETAAEIQSIIDDLTSKMNLGSALTNIIGATVDKSAGESLQLAIEHTTENNDAFMRGMGFVWNDLTQQWTATADSIKAVQAQIDGLRAQGKDTETINNLQAALNNLKNSMRDQRTNAIQDVVSNYSNISEESITAFETAFAGFGIDIRKYISTDALGNQKVDLAALNEALAKAGYDVNQLFQEEIAAIGDSYLQAISSGVSILSSGTNNLADISKIAKDLDPNLTAQDIGYYDEILKAWTIDGNVVRQYVEKQADKLKAMGIMPEDQVDKWVEQNTKGIASENIDIMGFLSGDKSQDDINKIGRALETYYEVIGWPVKTAREHVETALNTLIKGGEEAVAMAKGIKPTLTESELAEIYSSAFNRWNDMFNEIENIVVGDVVTGDLRKVLSQLNMVDGNGVVTSAFKMVDAYTAIYNQMKQTNGRTMTSLNAAYAKLLTAKDQSRIDAIDALGDAMGMSYDALGKLLARYGRSLEDELNNLYYERLGNGKVRITDFVQFANDLGLDTNSEEYLSAFKQYNESLIQLDRKTAKNIKDELSNLISAKAGTRLDISQLSNALGEDTINKLIHQYGGFVQDGILSLATSTDIPGMFAAIRDKIQSGENRTIQLTETELGELQDAIDGLLSNIISLISTGVSGSLNHAQAAELQSWASANGIQNLDFQPTVDGLKLTEESFFNLYATLSKINKLESKKLLPDMQKMSRSYGDLLSATREYNRTLTEAANDNNANKRQGLQDLIKSYLQDPNTYKTMGQQLPTEWQIAQNFYEDAYSGMQVLKSASAKKTMGVEDFYSMINTAGSLNPNFAINGMGMDELLDAAANSLQIVDGKLSVNLEKAGITAKNGMKQFSEGWLAGLENLRRTESGYLEAYTRFSKIHDQLEKIEPIDINNLFDKDGQFTDSAQEALQQLNGLLGKTQIELNGQNLNDLLRADNVDNWYAAGFDSQTAIKNFIANLSKIDFNADDIVTQMQDLLGKDKIALKMKTDSGFISIEPTGEVFEVNLDNDTIRKRLNEYLGKRYNKEELKQKVEEAWDKLHKDSEPIEFKDSETVEAYTTLALASGKIDTSSFTRNKSGKWSGYYNGKQFINEDKNALIQEIAEAMFFEEKGYQVTVKDGKAISINKKIGKATINYNGNSEKSYHAKRSDGKEDDFATEAEALDFLAESGDADQTGHHEYNGKSLDVYIDQDTGLYFTKHVDGTTTKWIYGGHEFTEYSAFRAYLDLINIYGDPKEFNENNEVIPVSSNAEIQLQIKAGQVVPTYLVNGNPVSKTEFDQWVEIQSLPDSKPIELNGGIGYTYERNGQTITVQITNDGIQFSVTISNGPTFTGDKATVEEAVSAYTKSLATLNPANGDVTPSKPLTITVDGYQIIIGVNGEEPKFMQDGRELGANEVALLLANNKQVNDALTTGKEAVVNVNKTKVNAEEGGSVTVDESLKATIQAAMAEIPAGVQVTAEIADAVSKIGELQDAIDNLQGKTVYVSVRETVTRTGAKGSGFTPKEPPGSIKNVNYTARAKGTLMGELGPELYVTNGHYYIAGKNGAEFVDLPDDAIVFNHLQTRKLLDKGTSGRGRTVTNEQKAVAQAKGNMNGGPAMANTMSGLTFIVTRYKSGSGTKTNATLDKDAKSAVSSLIQDVINKGFEYINLEDYKNLPAEVKALAQKAIANGSYRDFIAEVAEYSDKTVKEFNDLYMQSWQKDLGAKSGEMHGALSGITEYQNGMVGIAAGDLSTVLDKTKITELTNAGILAYSGLIDTYFVKSWDDLIKYVPNLVDNENIESYRKDGDSAARKKLEELYEKAYSEGLTNIERDQMKLYADLMKVDLSYLNWFEDSEGKLRLQFDSSTLSGIKSEGAKDAKAEASDAIDKAIISLINGEVVGYTEFLEASTNAQQAFGKDFDLKRLTGVVDKKNGYSSDDILSLFKTYELMQEQGRDVSKIYQAFKDKFSQTDLSLDDFQSYSAALKDAFEQGSIKENVFIELNRTLNDAFIEKTGKLATDIVNATSEEGISNTAATELIEELQGFGVDFSKAFVTNAQGKQVLDWSQIITQLQKLYEQYPEFGAQLTKKVMDSLPEEVLKDLDLTPLKEITEQMGKEAAKGYNKLLDTQADQMRESVKNVSSTIVDAFNGHISSADYNQFVDDITSLKLNPADYGFTETKQGWKTSFEGVLKLFNDLVKDFPEDAKQILNSVDFKELTAEQAAEYKKAIEDAVARGEITPAEAAKWVAPIDDALREKAGGISDLIVKAIKGTATATEVNNIRAQIQKDFGLSDNDMQNIQFEQTKNGAQLTKESALWMISHFPDATEYIEAYNDSVLTDLEEAEKSTLGAAKIIKDNLKYRQVTKKATISRQAIIDYANAIKQPINEDALKSFEADTEGNITVTMEELEEIFGSAFSPELDALLSDTILEQARNEEKEISDAMKDIFSGLNSEDGFSSIDWDQYKETLGPKYEEVKKDAETLSPIEFLNKYIDSFQGTISEINDITTASFKKQEQNTRGLYDVFTSSVSWDPYYELFTASGDALNQIFTNQGKELSEEWLNSLERDYKGNYKVSMQDLESQGIVFDKNLFEGYERWLQEQAKAREEQIHNDLSNVISTYIDQGFDAIDFRDYFDLPTETVQLIKESAELSKRDFVVRFAEAAGKTVSEMNQLYFEAWEKDIGLEATEAAKNMQYYFGGGMSGSSTDWQALLGDSVKVSELVRLGLLEYDEALNTYYSKNVEEIEQLTGIDVDDDAVTDSIRTAFEGIADQIMVGLDGALSNTDATKLKANLKHMGLGDVELDFSQGLEGLQLSQASAISLYTQLKKIDAIQANLMFKKLRESLEKSNDKYKTMTSLLENIYELQEKIDHAERYNSEKIKQFQEELALAKEIAAVRATSEDESFNFLDNEMPGALNNPLNYAQSWIDTARRANDALMNNKAFDFQEFYNVIMEANKQAQICGSTIEYMGMTLDGSCQSFHNAIMAGIDALGSDKDGNYGVLLNKLGTDMTLGAEGLEKGANDAIHSMAQSQIKIIDSLIAMLQAIVAMESMEGVDINMDGLLGFDEIFEDADLGDKARKFTKEYTEAAQQMIEIVDKDAELKAKYQSIKFNDVSWYDIIKSATTGMLDPKLGLDPETFAQINSVMYELSQSQDWDLNDVAQSFRNILDKNKSGFKGVIEAGDMLIDMSYDVAVRKAKDGKYKTPGGQEYNTATEAVNAGAIEALGIRTDKIEIDPITKQASGTLEIADTEVTVTAKGKGKMGWTYNGQEYGSEEAVTKAIYQDSQSELSFNAWKIDKKIVAPVQVIQDVEVSSISKEQASHLVGKTFDQIKDEYDVAKGDHVLELEFQARYGFKLDESSTSEDFEKLKEAAGIESKNVEITASVHMAEGSDGGLVSMLESGSATVTVDVVFNKGEDTAAPEAAEIPVSADTTQAEENINAAVQSADNAQGTIKVDSDTSKAEEDAQAAASKADLLSATIKILADGTQASSAISAVAAELSNLPSYKQITIEETTVKKEAKEDDSSTTKSSSQAKGNVSGGAMAKGTRTLMGELGPELYVTDGHYYIAGRDGAEFVDLPDDAIVFNHLQTAGLLGKGTTGRGRPITNERNAVSMATGSLGPAAAGAKEALAMLLQLRAMWQKLADSTVVDLAGMGGANLSKIAGWVDEVERWYNLLQQIAQLEKDINYQEALRRKIETDRIRDGALYYKTLQDSYDNYIEQANSHRELYESQQEYFNLRREQLNSENAPFSEFYTYDENAQLKFKDGSYEILADLLKQYDTGEVKYTPQEQFNILASFKNGELIEKYGKYDSSGQEIKASDFSDTIGGYENAVVKAILEKMEKEREEMQSLHDSIEEHETAYLEALTNGNELLQKIIDNQIQVENDVLAAIESREQAIIDELSEQKEQLQKETDKYIKGLNDALSKERQLYEKNNESSELTRLERQLAILRRSGGSASQIRSLESDIDSKRQDQYFSLQEEQINAVQEAADAQIQRLDTQIQLMEETLAFEKAHGMLWAEVEQIMASSSNEIVSFLAMYSKDYATQSTIQQQEWIREKQFEADLWTEYRSNAPDTIAEGIQKGSETVAEERYNPQEFNTEQLKSDEKNPAAGSTSIPTSSYSSGYSGGGGSYSAPTTSTTPKKDMKDYDRQKLRAENTKDQMNKAKEIMDNSPKDSLQHQDAEVAYNHYKEANALANENMTKIKNGDKNYVPDYSNPDRDKLELPSHKLEAQQELINNAKTQKALVEKNIDAARAQRQAYIDAGLTKDSEAVAAIDKAIIEQQGWIAAAEEEIKLRESWVKNGKVTPYKNGGIIDYTGLAMVHGSKEEPEAILNSKDYKLWKQSIGSNVWESIERERLEMQALHDTFNSVITNSSDSSIVIEKAEVNVNVEQIANDYDAKRMGEQALQEMVRIARKTGMATIRR